MSRLILIISVALAAPAAVAIEVEFLKSEFEPGEPVLARISEQGRVTVESDLVASATQVNVGEDGVVGLGPVNKPGADFVRIVGKDGKDAYAACLFFAPARKTETAAGDDAKSAKPAANRLRLTIADASKQVARPATNAYEPLLKKFSSGLTKKRLAQAAESEIGKWDGEYETAVICSVPGQQIACAVGSKRAVDLNVVLISGLIDSMVADKHLTAPEGAELRKVLALGNSVVLLGEPAPTWEALFDATGPGVNVTADKTSAQFAAKELVGYAEKYVFVLSVKPN